MNDHTDEWYEEPDLPPSESQHKAEIEDALKWLEGLTGTQGEQPPASNPSLESPFHGLLGGDEGDLPDWLREVPSALSSTQGEMESRLDWLAKMAQRESIEELPTLEWRRLSEPAQNTVLSALGEATAANLEADSLDQEQPDSPALASLGTIPEQDSGHEIEMATDLAELEALESSGFEETPVEDLDAAMAWIEELAASQDAPVEDIPTVADRALTSKLMMEAGLTDSPMDEMISDSALLDSIVPDNPFLEEEDSADTIVLGETTGPEGEEYTPTSSESATNEALAHVEPVSEVAGEEVLLEEETPASTIESAAVLTVDIPDEPDTTGEMPTAEEIADSEEFPAFGETDSAETSEPLSIAAAMALLDEMATTPPVEAEPAEPEPAAFTADSEMAAEELSPDETDAVEQSQDETSIREAAPTAFTADSEMAPEELSPEEIDEVDEIVAETDINEAEPAELERLLAEEAPWPDDFEAISSLPLAIEPESEATESPADSDLPLESPADPVEGEMIAASDELLQTLEDEVWSVEAAPWFEESPMLPEQEDETLVATTGDEELSTIPPLSVPDPIIDESPPIEEEAPLEQVLPESELYQEVDDQYLGETEAEETIPAVPVEEWTADNVAQMMADRNGARLEEALLAIDSLALPYGKTLAEIDAAWAEAAFTPRRDVMTALDWLESTLTPQPASPSLESSLVLDETQLIEHMPDDPDAVLAWLEQMSDEASFSPASPTYPSTDRQQSEAGSGLYGPPEDDLLDVDLLAMPDDPDEAMIWLESLARGGEPPPMPSRIEPATPERLDLPADTLSPESGTLDESQNENTLSDEESNTTETSGEPGDIDNHA